MLEKFIYVDGKLLVSFPAVIHDRFEDKKGDGTDD